MKKNSFLVVGGDERMIYAAEELSAKGFIVQVFGINKQMLSSEDMVADNLQTAIYNSRNIILPVPSSDQSYINAPLSSEKISLDLFSKNLNSDHLVFGGKFSPTLMEILSSQNISSFDYASREEFSILNAIATTEGAIGVALSELPITISGTSCMVLGFGRISKLLCRALKGLGAHVTATARKDQDIAWIQALGYTAIHTKEIQKNVEKTQIIFNTIPDLIINREVLSKLQKNCLVIDLASKPGGVDIPCAKQLDIKVIHALSLPGKVAPKTSGMIICDTILRILKQLEVNL